MDQLANLKDIHLPEQVSLWPLAMGWWLLILLTIVVITFASLKIVKQLKRSAIKRQAIKQLQQHQNLSTEQSLALLKWAYMHYFDRQDVAAKFGDQLLEQLASKLPETMKDNFIQQAQPALNECYRKSTIDLYANDFQTAALFWINNAVFHPKPVKLTAEVAHD